MKKKNFDCVKMKRDIQERILQEIQGLSREERLELLEKKILDDPILAKLWRCARSIDSIGV